MTAQIIPFPCKKARRPVAETRSEFPPLPPLKPLNPLLVAAAGKMHKLKRLR